MGLEVVALWVAEVESGRAVCQGIRWRADAEVVASRAFRVAQATPANSAEPTGQEPPS